MTKIKTYTVTTAEGSVIAEGVDKKTAAALVRDLGGYPAATFEADIPPMRFEPAQQFTVREWSETLRAAGHIRG